MKELRMRKAYLDGGCTYLLYKMNILYHMAHVMRLANASTTKIKRFLSIINPEFKFNNTYTEVDEIIKEGVCTSNGVSLYSNF
jgi:hypothetical protein